MGSTQDAGPDRWRTAAAVIAAVQGLALIANALAVTYFVVRDGITAPSTVASPAGVALEIVLFLLFGAALLFIAHGLRTGRAAVLTPFLLAQILGLTVGIPLVRAPDGVGAVGLLVTGACAAGIAAWLVLVRRAAAAGAPAAGGS
jgi:hypothetical protein